MQQTNNLHTILTYAREEAGRLGNIEIMPDHMLLGILRLGAGKAFELLMQAGLDPAECKRRIDERLRQAESTQTQKLSRASERIIRLTGIEARSYQAETCGSVHLLMGLLRDRINYPAMYLEQQHGIDYECIERLYPKPDPLPQGELTLDGDTTRERETTIHIFGPEMGDRKQKGKTDTPALTKYGRDLTLQASKGELDPVIGRQLEIERVIQILSRRKKNNPILIGEPGVGKSAIVEGLALRIVAKEIPALEGKRIIALDIASMVAGTTYRGQFEERIKTVIKELNQHPEFILFIDDLSFQKDDDNFSALKAILEGSVSARSSNVVIYATSNRRHLVKESFSGRDGDDVHRNDTLQEMISLSERFGIQITFQKPTKATYLDIVHHLCAQRGVEMDEKELDIKAEAFALSRGGRSARAATQFVDGLVAKK